MLLFNTQDLDYSYKKKSNLNTQFFFQRKTLLRQIYDQA